MKPLPALVFFDFDGTLTKHDSLVPFLWSVCGPLRLIRGVIESLPSLLGYALKVVSNDRAKECLLYHTLKGRTVQELSADGQHFAASRIPGMLRADTMGRLNQHIAAGDVCVLLSASLDMYLRPWALEAGFCDVLCSRLEIDATGKATGRLEGKNCYGEEKVRRARKYISKTKYINRNIICYGDTAGDYPILEFSSEGYYCADNIISTYKNKKNI